MASPVTKKAAEHEYTPERVKELLRCAQDAAYFISTYVKIQHPMMGMIPFQLYPYQVEMLHTMQRNRKTIILSARQTGKALPLTQEIPTPTGWTTMGDIKIGDQVLGADGLPTNVVSATDVMYDHKCYEMTLSTGEKFVADAEHLWEVQDEYTKIVQNLTTEQLAQKKLLVSEKNQARYTIRTTKALQLPDANLLVDPYMLGVWLGDGSTKCGEYTSHSDDRAIAHRLIESNPQYEFNIRPYGTNRLHIDRIGVHGLQTDLRTIGVLGNKHIPIEYLRGSYTQRLELLRGLMDTDGTTDKNTGTCEIGLSHKILAYDVLELVSSLGLKATIKIKKTTHKDCYCIRFMAYRDELEVFHLKRKLVRQKQSPSVTRMYSTKKRSIVSIVPTKSAPVRCIVVDNYDHMFLIGRTMVPTHNSQTSAAFLLWYALFNEDKTVLIASNKNSNALEMISRIRYMYETVPDWLKSGITADGWNKLSVGFTNKSRIISTATSESSGRGLSISLLFCDELAFVSRTVQEEFWKSISPTLSTGGGCIISSTPNGEGDLYANLWHGAELGTNGFAHVYVAWDEPPGRDEAFKQEKIGELGMLAWRQEFECEFLTSEALLIDAIFLNNLDAIIKKNRPIKEEMGVSWYDTVKEGNIYLMGVDPSAGSGKDFSVIQVFEFPTLIQVAEFRSNAVSSPQLYNILKYILRVMEKVTATCYFSVENNGVGEGVIALYQNDEAIPESGQFISEEGRARLGMTTTNRSKLRACLNLKSLIEAGKFRFKSAMLLKELKSYASGKGSYEALPGATDDLVAACLIVVRLLSEISAYEQAAFDSLYSYDESATQFGDDPSEQQEEPLAMLF